jgi:hypothetical protein
MGTAGDGREVVMSWNMFLLKLKYQKKYWFKKLYNSFGYCPCGTRTNVTTLSRHICPRCGR